MKFCNCGNMLNIFDDISNRILYHHCKSCDLKIPFTTKLIESKPIFTFNKNLTKYDKTLPISDKICFKCNSSVIYEKKQDLTLVFFCNNCNEQWF